MAASRSAVRERATCRSSRLCAATNLAHASSLVGASVAWINRDSSKGRTADIDAPAPVPAIGAPELGAEWPVNVQATRGTHPFNAYACPSRFPSTPFLTGRGRGKGPPMKIVIRRDPVANKDRVPRDAARDSGGY